MKELSAAEHRTLRFKGVGFRRRRLDLDRRKAIWIETRQSVTAFFCDDLWWL